LPETGGGNQQVSGCAIAHSTSSLARKVVEAEIAKSSAATTFIAGWPRPQQKGCEKHASMSEWKPISTHVFD